MRFIYIYKLKRNNTQCHSAIQFNACIQELYLQADMLQETALNCILDYIFSFII